MNKIFVAFLITFFSAIICSSAFAEADEPRWYQIELILFSNNLPEESITEMWPEFPGTSSIENKLDLVFPNLIDKDMDAPGLQKSKNNTGQQTSSEMLIQPFSVVDRDQYLLTVSARKLEHSPDYNLLLHISWRQPAFRSNNNSAVYLHDGLNELGDRDEMMLMNEEFKSDASNSPATRNTETAGIDPYSDTINIDYNQTGPIGPESEPFFGTFKVTLSRFLHINIDMIYRGLIKQDLAVSPTEIEITDIDSINDDPEMQTEFNQGIENEMPATFVVRDFRLKASRRVKPDEIHYFDHPLFGIITMVTRYEPPKPEEEESPMQPFIP